MSSNRLWLEILKIVMLAFAVGRQTVLANEPPPETRITRRVTPIYKDEATDENLKPSAVSSPSSLVGRDAEAGSPNILPVETLFRNFQYNEVKLSPDGNFLAALAPNKQRVGLVAGLFAEISESLKELSIKSIKTFCCARAAVKGARRAAAQQRVGLD